MNEKVDFQTFDECYREATRFIEGQFLEATTSVERELAVEDKGWVNLSGVSSDIAPQKRISLVQLSRLYYAFDPLAAQAIRLWTDYTFGTGMTWEVDEEKVPATKKTLEAFWNKQDNKPMFGSRGQRRSSDKFLVDGEIFFALFLAKESTIRTIDPLEIVEIITDQDDIEKPMYYKRSWSDSQGKPQEGYYRSHLNLEGKSAKDAVGGNIQKTQDAVVYHLARGLGQRGSGLLVPGLEILKYSKKFVAARVAMMLARTRFASKLTIEGGAAAAGAAKATIDDKTPQAASTLILNKAIKEEPIQPPQDARNAYDDYRMLKLQFCAAVGIPEQYFGDIATGNLATAKTVELPMLKMFQSNQSVWGDTYQDIFELVFGNDRIPPDKWYVDINFPLIAPEDIFAAAQAIVQIVTAFPEFTSAPEIQQQALMVLGINDPAQVIDSLTKSEESDPSVALAKVLKRFRESMRESK